jgi:hypothetical protein
MGDGALVSGDARVEMLRLSLADLEIYQNDVHTLQRFLAEFSTVERAREKCIAAHRWRQEARIDSLKWEWPTHQGSNEVLIRNYWPGAIMGARAYNGSTVQLHRFGNVDFFALERLQLTTAAVLHSTYLNEVSLHLDPRGQQVMIFDIGCSLEDMALGTDVLTSSIDRQLGSLISFLRAMSSTIKDHAPQIWSRIFIVRAPRITPVVWATMSRWSSWWEGLAQKVSFHADCALPELLKWMPIEAVPQCLGGADRTVFGTGGFLVAPQPVCLLPWQLRPTVKLWSLEEAIARAQAAAPSEAVIELVGSTANSMAGGAVYIARPVHLTAAEAAAKEAAVEETRLDEELESATAMVQVMDVTWWGS